MADDLFLLQYGAWDDPNWEDTTPPPPGSLVAADYGGGLNDLNIGTGIGGVMTGDGAADTLQVAEPYPGFGTIEFDGTVSADFFELSASSTMDTGPGLIIDGGDLVTSGTLIVGAGATLEVSGGGAIDSSGTVQVFGAIDVNGGSITADQLYIQGTLDLISGSGTIATLVVGSFTGTGGLGGIGELEIAAGNTITVSVGLAVANQQGTGIVAINGGVLIVNGAADVGEAGEAKNPGIGSLTITAGGSMSVSDTLDIGVSADGIGTVAVSGDDSTASLGGLVVGDASIGTLTMASGAQVTTSDDVVIGATLGGTGLVTVNDDDTLLHDGGGLTVGAGGSGEIDINQGSVEVFAGTITLGESASASGTLTLANSSLDLSGSLLIGEAGSGSLSVGSDGTLQAQDITLGQSTNGGGNLTIAGDGASVQSSGLTVGAGGSGVLAVSAQGSLDTTGAAILGSEALPLVQQQASVVGGAQWAVGSGLTIGEAGNASMTIGSGGEVSAGSVVLGNQGGASGTVTVGGTVGVAGGGSAASSLLFGGELIVGNAGTAALSINQGGVVGLLGTLSGTIEIGAGSSGVGSISVNDGTVSAASLIVAKSGSGTISVSSGGIVMAGSVQVGSSGTISLAGGLLDPVAAMTLAAGGTVAGFGTLQASVVDGGVVDASGGTLDITGSVSGDGSLRLGAGSTLRLDAAIGTTPTVAFTSGTAALVLGNPSLNASLFSAMTGVAAGDQIEFGNGATITSVSYTPVTGGQNVVLDVIQDSTAGTITLNDVQFTGGADQFDFTNPGSGDATLQATHCFCAGTGIATPGGEAPVQQLAVGDVVLTQRGAARRIVWIGIGRVLATRGQRSAATPVIVRKGALAENVPHRDLRVTKGHAFHIDGVLIPVEFLVNHRSILWDDRAQEVALYHIELGSHDVLLANGAPAESYRDDGNRWLFQNANSGWNLPPQTPCAPVLTGGPIVDAVWRRLLDRTGPRSSLPLTGDADLHLMVDGRRIDAIEQRDDLHTFPLRTPARVVRIRSLAAVPQELGILRDNRPLGVALRRIELTRPGWQRALESDAASLIDGYHTFEPDNGIRWTNGDAAVPAELFADLNGPCTLSLHLGGATRYLDEGRPVKAA